MTKPKTDNNPLMIYIAENDHGDMSYGSLIEEIIKDCHRRGLSTKTFSEFASQTAKSQKQKARTSELMSLENNRQSVTETAKFLDGQFIEMGSIAAREPMFENTLKTIPEATTPEQLAEAREGNVDNPELLRLMKDDLRTGVISKEVFGTEQISDLKNFYALWRQPLHFKQIHEAMVKDVRSDLENGIPDVLIIVAGTPHIQGLDQQLIELKDSKKVVVGNVPQCSTLIENIQYNGNPKLIDGIGARTEFSVDPLLKKAVIPALVTDAISEKAQLKRSQFSSLDTLDLEFSKKPSPNPERSYAEKMSQVKGSKFNEI